METRRAPSPHDPLLSPADSLCGQGFVVSRRIRRKIFGGDPSHLSTHLDHACSTTFAMRVKGCDRRRGSAGEGF